jgi:molybdate transport system regulatory protein
MKPRFNLWVEAGGAVVLSAWRVRLLEAIQASGSIRAAAERLDIPYRRAWEKVHEMEEGCGLRLLETEVGGEGGGGARLTDEAKDFVERFHQFEAGLEDEILLRYEGAFGPPPTAPPGRQHLRAD